MQTYLTKLSILLLLVTQILSGYSFTMEVDNHSPMIGEKITLTLQFRYDNVEEYILEEPNYGNFDISLIDDNEVAEGNVTWIAIQHYTIVATKAGSFTLNPLKAHIEYIPLDYQDKYNKSHYLQKQDIYTKTIVIQVSPLPQDIQVTGDYTLQSHLDKHQSTQGSPVQFTLSLLGEGNIDNLNFFSLNIPHTTIYEISISPHRKTFNIVSSQSYIIPPILLRYFNQKTKSVTLTSTPSYAVNISENTLGNTTDIYILLLLVVLLVLSSGYGFYVLSEMNYLDEKKVFIKKLMLCKNSQQLLKKIAPHLGKNRILDRLIYQLDSDDVIEFKAHQKKIIAAYKNCSRN